MIAYIDVVAYMEEVCKVREVITQKMVGIGST